MFLHMILKIKLFKYIQWCIISEDKNRQRLSKCVLDKFFNVNIIIIIIINSTNTTINIIFLVI